MENDPITGAKYDVVASLVHEVDGRAFLGKPLAKDESNTSHQSANNEQGNVALHSRSGRCVGISGRHDTSAME